MVRVICVYYQHGMYLLSKVSVPFNSEIFKEFGFGFSEMENRGEGREAAEATGLVIAARNTVQISEHDNCTAEALLWLLSIH